MKIFIKLYLDDNYFYKLNIAKKNYLGLYKMARSEGFEPSTLGLENRCSIQLS